MTSSGNNETNHVRKERLILERLRHPFLVKFYQAFQTKHKLHLILEFANGGDLYTHLNARKNIPDDNARFYAAEIICALQYLHENGIIFRGLKPEDVLLESSGHIKLSDFGLAKSEDSMTSTFWGSPLYLAPEVIKGEKQTKAIDWWSLGVLIYEMLVGEPPFWDNDSKKLLMSILEDKVTFSEEVSKDAWDLVTKLLDPNPASRLGCGCRGVDEIKDHPFFKDINWTDVYMKRIRPPFIPLIKSESDVSNVDFLFTSGKLTRNTFLAFGTESSASVFDNYTFVGYNSSAVEDNPSPSIIQECSDKQMTINDK